MSVLKGWEEKMSANSRRKWNAKLKWLFIEVPTISILMFCDGSGITETNDNKLFVTFMNAATELLNTSPKLH